jgi:hemoglobin/transferrin/lactoferrin receptor protein
VDPLIITATRTPRPVFLTPVAASVVDSIALQRLKPNTITETFREVPGLDVTGVGVQQPRPIIRGQRGQRILLLSDGIRLNNSRRQQDFGEVPALVDPSQVERVEIVRGPASVLYGTDAIGGVVNIITQRPMVDGWHGRVSYLFGAEEEQHRGAAMLHGRLGGLDVQANAMVRQAGDYSAPEGRFGNIELDSATHVKVTGIDDWSAALRLGWDVAANHSLFVRGERYEAKDAGFGFVEPSAYEASQPRIEIRYPDQAFTRVALGWSATGLALPVADRAELVTYAQDNERTLTFDLFQGFGPRAPPGAGVQINTHNFADLRTYGFRFEARKLVGSSTLFTWGADFFRDGSENSDSSLTSVVGFGPPQVEVSTQPQVPNATYRSAGAFLQGEFTAGRTTLVLGGRIQDIQAKAEEGQGVPTGLTSKGRSTVVGAANLLVAASDNITLVGTVGRGFRAPNLIEWFFDGPTPEGSGYQVRSPDLEPETSVNVDLGIRYRDRRLALEAFVFRNHVRDGIRIQPTGDTVQGFPAYRNVNLDKLRFQGIEIAGEAALVSSLSLIGTYTKIESEDELDPSNPIGDSYSSKITGALRWMDPATRFWAEYAVRYNGERKDVALLNNPLGDRLPSFTTHAVRGGVSLPRRGNVTPRIGIAVENLTNELYAEASNASFFRPEPRRRISLSAEVGF